MSFLILFLSRFWHFNVIQCPPSYCVSGFGDFVCIDISSCYHNLAALMRIFTFLSTLVKYMLVDVLCWVHKLQWFQWSYFGDLQNNEKIWISWIDKALLFHGKNTVQAKQWLEKCYPTASLGQMVEKWFADFKRGRTNTDDVERSGRPNSAVVSEK